MHGLTHPIEIAAGVVSLGTFLGTLVAVPIFLVKVPDDYFTRPRPPSPLPLKVLRITLGRRVDRRRRRDAPAPGAGRADHPRGPRHPRGPAQGSRHRADPAAPEGSPRGRQAASQGAERARSRYPGRDSRSARCANPAPDRHALFPRPHSHRQGSSRRRRQREPHAARARRLHPQGRRRHVRLPAARPARAAEDRVASSARR